MIDRRSFLAQTTTAAVIPGLGLVYREHVLRELGRRGPVHFGWWLSDEKEARAAHLRWISDQIAAEIEKGGARILLCAPPRHGKSNLISKNTSGWHVFKWPEKHVILCAYGAEFARGWGEKVRDLMVRSQARTGVPIKGGKNAAGDLWETDQGGGMKCAGVMGDILGRGADLLIIDDPVKNAMEAYSPTYQQRLQEWYQSTARSRLEPKGSVIVTMQRWPSSDFISWLVDQRDAGRENWILLSLPAVAGLNDQMGRKPGAALWPARYDEAALEAVRIGLEDQSFWHAQWQQSPLAESREGLCYHQFDSMANVLSPEEMKHDPELPLVWGLDFNVDPMCSVIGQVKQQFSPAEYDWLHNKRVDEVSSKNIRILEEICLPNSSTQAATNEFISRCENNKWFPRNGQKLQVVIYGDASGHSRKTTAPADYRVIEEILRHDGRFIFSIRAAKDNPGVRERVTTVNNAFLRADGVRRLHISKACRELQKDLLFMRWKRDVAGNPTGEMDKSNPQRSHISDALGYLIFGEMKMKAKSGWQSGERLV